MPPKKRLASTPVEFDVWPEIYPNGTIASYRIPVCPPQRAEAWGLDAVIGCYCRHAFLPSGEREKLLGLARPFACPVSGCKENIFWERPASAFVEAFIRQSGAIDAKPGTVIESSPPFLSIPEAEYQAAMAQREAEVSEERATLQQHKELISSIPFAIWNADASVSTRYLNLFLQNNTGAAFNADQLDFLEELRKRIPPPEEQEEETKPKKSSKKKRPAQEKASTNYAIYAQGMAQYFAKHVHKAIRSSITGETIDALPTRAMFAETDIQVLNDCTYAMMMAFIDNADMIPGMTAEATKQILLDNLRSIHGNYLKQKEGASALKKKKV